MYLSSNLITNFQYLLVMDATSPAVIIMQKLLLETSLLAPFDCTGHAIAILKENLVMNLRSLFVICPMVTSKPGLFIHSEAHNHWQGWLLDLLDSPHYFRWNGNCSMRYIIWKANLSVWQCPLFFFPPHSAMPPPDQCALDEHSKLKDAKDILFYDLPTDETPIQPSEGGGICSHWCSWQYIDWFHL